MDEKKRFKNKKFENENHKGAEKGAKAAKGALGALALAPIVIALKKGGAKTVKEGVKLALKVIFRA